MVIVGMQMYASSWSVASGDSPVAVAPVSSATEFTVESCDDDEANSDDSLERLKAATVFIKVVTSAGAQSGSGFLLEKNGKQGAVVTNAHVIRVTKGKLQSIECVFYSGTRQEYSVRSNVIGSDEVDDLAVLSVEHDKLPEPLDSESNVQLRETLPVLILGFPFGEGLATGGRSPAITISKASVSSIRRNDDDRVALIQLDGGINSGNSGGPIVTQDGKLVGIAVAKLSGTDIGFAVPRWKLAESLRGSITGVTIARKRSGPQDGLDMSVSVIDPRNLIAKVSVMICPTASIAQAKPNADGRWSLASESMEEILLQHQGLNYVGHIAYDSKATGRSFQLQLERRDGTKSYTGPSKLDAKADANADAKRSTPKGKAPDANAMEGQAGLSKVAAFEVPGASLLPYLVWSRDEVHCITLSRGGLLQKFSLETFQEVQNLDLKAKATFLGKSKDGVVVVLDEVQQVVSIDEETFEVKRKIKVPGVSIVGCSPSSSVAYHFSDKVFSAIDLRAGKIKPLTFEVKPVRNNIDRGAINSAKFLTCSPDGKFLFFEDSNRIKRLRIAGPKLLFEESSPLIGQNPQSMVVSPDSKFVALPSGGGNSNVEGHPNLSYGTYIYSIANLQKAHLGISTGAYPRCLGIDPVANKIYAQNRELPLMVFTMDGTREAAFSLPNEGETRLLLSHPQGNRVCVMTERFLFWVVLKDASDELIDRKANGKAVTETPEKKNPSNKSESPSAITRVWQDKSGKFKISAKLVEVDGDLVVLEKEDGTQAKVPLSKLSEADQEFAKQK